MPVSVSTPRGLSRLAAPLRALIVQQLRREGRRAGEIGVVLAGDALLREMNRAWRGQDHATDVISFAYDERERDAATRPVSGDLLVSLDRVTAQAKRYRVSPGRELARLVVHGTLHLCGHDHQRAAERAHMRAREEAALSASRSQAIALDRVLAVAQGPARAPAAVKSPARSAAAKPRARRANARPARRDGKRRAR